MVEGSNQEEQKKPLSLQEQAALRGPPTSDWVTRTDPPQAQEKPAVKKKKRPVMAKLIIADKHGEAPNPMESMQRPPEMNNIATANID